VSFLEQIESLCALAGKSVGKLYLFLSPEKLEIALKSGVMRPLGSSQPMAMRKKALLYKNSFSGDSVFNGISTTRNKAWKPNETLKHGYWAEIRLTLDGDKLSHNHLLVPYNDFWKFDDYAKKKRDSKDEFYSQSETKIVTDKNGLKNWTKYLLAVDVLEDVRDTFEKMDLQKYLKNVPVRFVNKFS
jgi:hypothetical protein